MSAPLSPPVCYALLPCAGIGSRAAAQDASGQAIPKQYQTLLGQSLVQHTLQALAQVPQISRMVVVLAPHDAYFATHCQLPAQAEAAFVGGSSRAESVAHGLAYLRQEMGAKPEDWVLVHDAARCLIEPAWVEALMAACLSAEQGGLLALPVADTLKQGDSQQRVVQTVERSDKWLAQTPQMFPLGALQQALARTGSGVSDEASAMELEGHAPLLVRGHTHNFKVTYPEDFALAEALLRLRQQAQQEI